MNQYRLKMKEKQTTNAVNPNNQYNHNPMRNLHCGHQIAISKIKNHEYPMESCNVCLIKILDQILELDDNLKCLILKFIISYTPHDPINAIKIQNRYYVNGQWSNTDKDLNLVVSQHSKLSEIRALINQINENPIEFKRQYKQEISIVMINNINTDQTRQRSYDYFQNNNLCQIPEKLHKILDFLTPFHQHFFDFNEQKNQNNGFIMNLDNQSQEIIDENGPINQKAFQLKLKEKVRVDSITQQYFFYRESYNSYQDQMVRYWLNQGINYDVIKQRIEDQLLNIENNSSQKQKIDLKRIHLYQLLEENEKKKLGDLKSKSELQKQEINEQIKKIQNISQTLKNNQEFVEQTDWILKILCEVKENSDSISFIYVQNENMYKDSSTYYVIKNFYNQLFRDSQSESVSDVKDGKDEDENEKNPELSENYENYDKIKINEINLDKIEASFDIIYSQLRLSNQSEEFKDQKNKNENLDPINLNDSLNAKDLKNIKSIMEVSKMEQEYARELQINNNKSVQIALNKVMDPLGIDDKFINQVKNPKIIKNPIGSLQNEVNINNSNQESIRSDLRINNSIVTNKNESININSNCLNIDKIEESIESIIEKILLKRKKENDEQIKELIKKFKDQWIESNMDLIKCTDKDFDRLGVKIGLRNDIKDQLNQFK